MPKFRTMLSIALPALSALMLAAPAHADVKGAAVQHSVKDGVDSWERGDYQRAVTVWRPLAIDGDPDAQFNLGQAYKLGRGVPTDLGQAEVWYRRAAKQGHLQAEDNLGLVLFTANRREEAMPFIIRSAERGEPRAQYVLGTAHFNGDLAAQDWPRAYALTKRASDAGLSIASARLAQLDGLIPLEQRQYGLAMLPKMERDEQRARLTAVADAAPPPPKPAVSPVKTASLPPSLPSTSYAPPPVIKAVPVAPAPAPLLSPAATAAAVAATEATAAANAVPIPVRPVPQPIPSVEIAAATPAGTTYEAPEGLEELPSTADIPAPVAPPAPAPAPAPPPVQLASTPVPAQPVPASSVETVRVHAALPQPAAAAAATVPATVSPWRAQFGAFANEANARNLWSALEQKYPAFASRQPYLVKNGRLTRLQIGNLASKAEAESICATVKPGGQACLVVNK